MSNPGVAKRDAKRPAQRRGAETAIAPEEAPQGIEKAGFAPGNGSVHHRTWRRKSPVFDRIAGGGGEDFASRAQRSLRLAGVSTILSGLSPAIASRLRPLRLASYKASSA